MLRKYHYDVVSCLRCMCSSTVSTMPAGMSPNRLPPAAATVTVAAAADCGTTTPASIGGPWAAQLNPWLDSADE